MDEIPSVPQSEDESGWTLPASDESESDDLLSESTSSHPGNPNTELANESDKVPSPDNVCKDFDREYHKDDAEEQQPISVKSILAAVLFCQGVIEPLPSSWKYTFTNLADSISCNTPLTAWLTATSTPPQSLVLRLPEKLNNVLFLSSLRASFIREFSSWNPVIVSTKTTEPTQYDFIEHLLASICFQLLEQTDNIDMVEENFHDDLLCSFQGYNQEWKRAILWSLMKFLLLTNTTGQVLLVISLNESPHLSYPALHEFLDLVTSTERQIKLLIITSCQDSLQSTQLVPLNISLDDDIIKDALKEDMKHCLQSFLVSKPRLSCIESQILDNLEILRHDPLLLNSYLGYLESLPWITRAQIEEDNELLSNPDAFFQSILAKVPETHSLIVSDAILLAFSTIKPLQAAEFASALSIARVPDVTNSKMIEKKIPLDVPFSMYVSLGGIINEDPEGALGRVAHPSLQGIIHGEFNNRKPPWLVSRDEEMEMATICFEYMKLWKYQQGNQPTTSTGVSSEKWPFLRYAITFWYRHYCSASDVKPIGITFAEDWEVLKTWIMLWSNLQPWGSSQQKLDQRMRLLPQSICNSFGVSYKQAILISLVSSQALSLVDENEEIAVLWAAWLFHSDQGPPFPVSDLTPAELPVFLKLLPRAPLQSFQLIKQNESFVHDNATVILTIAMQQGVAEVVIHCLDTIELDEDKLLSFPWALCARYGNMKILQRLAKKWPKSTNIRNSLGSKLLHEAVKNGHFEIVELILGCQFDVDFIENTDTALILSTKLGLTKISSLLLQNNASVSKTDAHGRGALHHACQRGHVIVAELLVNKGALWTACDHRNDTPLHIAVRRGHCAVVELFIRTHQAKINKSQRFSSAGTEAKESADDSDMSLEDDILGIENEDNMRPLDITAIQGNEKIFALLVENDLSGRAMEIPLRQAALVGNLGILHYILSTCVVNINDLDQRDQSALHIASANNQVEIVKQLLVHGANAWTIDTMDDYPINDAAGAGHEEVVKLLLSTQPEAADLGEAVRRATCFGSASIVKLLLDARAQPYGGLKAILHLAARIGNEDIVRLLIMHHSEVDTKDEYGDTPLSDAILRGHIEVVRMLVDAGASLEIMDSLGDKPLHIASRKGDVKMVKLLLAKGALVEVDPTGNSVNLLEQLVNNHQNEVLGVILDHLGDQASSALLNRLFHLALRNEDVDMISFLLDKNADPNAIIASRKYGSALQECAYYGNLKMAKALVKLLGPEIIKTRGGRFETALIACVCRRDTRSWNFLGESKRHYTRQRKMLKYLLLNGADPIVMGGPFGNLLNASVACASVHLVDDILQDTRAKATVTTTDQEGRTAAHLACITTRYEARRKLTNILQQCTDGNTLAASPDKQGRQPLHFASGHGNARILFPILQRDRIRVGENKEVVSDDENDAYLINAVDNDGWTPLHWACRQGNLIDVEFLVGHGANVEAETEKPRNLQPWHVAVLYGNNSGELHSILRAGKKSDGEDMALEPGEEHYRIICDSCFMSIQGDKHRCQNCADFDFCGKCYKLNLDIHDSRHRFIKS